MAQHGVLAGAFFHEFFDQAPFNLQNLFISCRARDTYQPSRFAGLRYLRRVLLKPPDVPRTPQPDLTLDLYRLYGHPFTRLLPALEGHITCWIVKVLELLRFLGRITSWCAVAVATAREAKLPFTYHVMWKEAGKRNCNM